LLLLQPTFLLLQPVILLKQTHGWLLRMSACGAHNNAAAVGVVADA
jgi:hypothetical protein